MTDEDAIQDELDANFAYDTIEKLKKLTHSGVRWDYSGVTGPGLGEPRCQNFHGWPDQADPESGKVAVIHLWYEEPDLDPVTGDDRENGWGAGLDMPLGTPILPTGVEYRKTVDQAFTALLDDVNRQFIMMSMRMTQTIGGLLQALPGVVLSGMLPGVEGRAMEKARFIEKFVASFLANWAVHQYGMACAGGLAGNYMRSAPVEDAKALAEQAWEVLNG